MLTVTNLVENYNLYIAGGLVRKRQHNADFKVTKQMQLKCHDRYGYGVPHNFAVETFSLHHTQGLVSLQCEKQPLRRECNVTMRKNALIDLQVPIHPVFQLSWATYSSVVHQRNTKLQAPSCLCETNKAASFFHSPQQFHRPAAPLDQAAQRDIIYAI